MSRIAIIAEQPEFSQEFFDAVAKHREGETVENAYNRIYVDSKEDYAKGMTEGSSEEYTEEYKVIQTELQHKGYGPGNLILTDDTW